MTILDLNPIPELRGAKWAFTTRRVHRGDVVAVQPQVQYATAGDLIICEITEINQHKKLQLANQRYSLSYPGDIIVACVGDRYAPDQFKGRAEVNPLHADLMAGGGIVGTVEAAHGQMSRPTALRPIGLLVDAEGEIINIARYGLAESSVAPDVTVIGVFGASMNAGKTTAAVSLAHGLKQAGFRVGGVKATGTGAFGDFNAFEDAGVPALDFTDAGMPSTYRMPLDRIEQGFQTLVGTAAERGAEIVVVEIADGVFQRETAALLSESAICDRMDGILFAAPDALSAVGGVEILRQHGKRPFAISGMVTRSPLASTEAEGTTGVPMISRSGLCDADTVMDLVRPILRNPHLPAKSAA